MRGAGVCIESFCSSSSLFAVAMCFPLLADRLPDVLRFEILSFVDSESLAMICCTSPRVLLLASDDRLWKRLLPEDVRGVALDKVPRGWPTCGIDSEVCVGYWKLLHRLYIGNSFYRARNSGHDFWKQDDFVMRGCRKHAIDETILISDACRRFHLVKSDLRLLPRRRRMQGSTTTGNRKVGKTWFNLEAVTLRAYLKYGGRTGFQHECKRRQENAKERRRQIERKRQDTKAAALAMCGGTAKSLVATRSRVTTRTSKRRRTS